MYPPAPIPPDPRECCGRNCVNCVFVYHQRAMQAWRERCAALRQAGDPVPLEAPAPE